MRGYGQSGVEMTCVNECEGRSQFDESSSRWSEFESPTKLSDDLAKVKMVDYEQMADADEPANYELINAQAEADARAKAAFDARAAFDAQMATLSAMAMPEQASVIPAPIDEKEQINLLVARAQAATGRLFPTLATTPGKRKTIDLAPAQNYGVRQVETTSKQNVEARISMLERLNGCDLSVETIASERDKEKTLLTVTIPRLTLEMQVSLERKAEYASKHAIWEECQNLRTLANLSARIDPKLNATSIGRQVTPKGPKTPQAKALAKLQKARENAQALGLQV